MKKYFIVLAFVSFANVIFSQRKVAPSDEIKIEGKIKTELKFSIQDLEKFPTRPIKDLEIVNKHDSVKGTAKGLKGFPLKTILDKIEIVTEKPRELNEYYFTFIATDGYKVVFSWNELFNTEVGNNIFVITEKDGKKLSEMQERVLVVSTSDLKIGRRYIKGLCKIVVDKVN